MLCTIYVQGVWWFSFFGLTIKYWSVASKAIYQHFFLPLMISWSWNGNPRHCFHDWCVQAHVYGGEGVLQGSNTPLWVHIFIFCSLDCQRGRSSTRVPLCLYPTSWKINILSSGGPTTKVYSTSHKRACNSISRQRSLLAVLNRLFSQVSHSMVACIRSFKHLPWKNPVYATEYNVNVVWEVIVQVICLTRSLREPGRPCTKSMEDSESRMERVKRSITYVSPG